MDVCALPAGFFEHAGDEVAVRGNYPQADRTNPWVFVVCGIAEGAAENVGYPFGYGARLYPSLKNNAFDAQAFFENARAEGTGLWGTAPRSPDGFAQPPFVFAAPFPRARLLGMDKKGAARHQGQHQIGNEQREQKKQGIQKNQLIASAARRIRYSQYPCRSALEKPHAALARKGF
jgi:hypothetical protein